jgi:DNA invertase Pin-like site-specific DNA recombinase
MPAGRPKLFKNKEALQEKIDIYKQYLEDSDKPPTIAGLAYYTGIDRQTLYNYKKDAEFFGTIKRFVDWVIMTYEETAITNSSGGVIFLLKNYGYTDKQEIDINANVKNQYDEMSDKDIEKELRRYDEKAKD